MWIRKHWGKAIPALAIVGLSAVTLMKDNVHFGSTDFYSGSENQYVWGLFPEVQIKDGFSGDMRTYGLFTSINLESGTLMVGDMTSAGLIAATNVFHENSVYKGAATAYAIGYAGNIFRNGVRVSGDVIARGAMVDGLHAGGVGAVKELGLENVVNENL